MRERFKRETFGQSSFHRNLVLLHIKTLLAGQTLRNAQQTNDAVPDGELLRRRHKPDSFQSMKSALIDMETILISSTM